MRTGLALRAAGMATGLFLAITFSLCVAFDLLAPHHAMYHTWFGIVPGFLWLTWQSFARSVRILRLPSLEAADSIT